METIGRIALSVVLLVAVGATQKLGAHLIRIPHEPFDLAEIGGIIIIGASWLLAGCLSRLWNKPPKAKRRGMA